MCTGRQMFAEVVQPLLSRFIQGFNTTVSHCPRLAVQCIATLCITLTMLLRAHDADLGRS